MAARDTIISALALTANQQSLMISPELEATMKKAQAEQLLQEMEQDTRLQAALNTRRASKDLDTGFRIDVTLCRERLHVTVSSPLQWKSIQLAWDGL